MSSLKSMLPTDSFSIRELVLSDRLDLYRCQLRIRKIECWSRGAGDGSSSDISKPLGALALCVAVSQKLRSFRDRPFTATLQKKIGVPTAIALVVPGQRQGRLAR